MVRYAIVGLASALAGGLAVWAVRPSAEGDRAHVARSTRAVRGAGPDARSRTEQPAQADLNECRRALVQQRAELRLVREEAARVEEERVLDDDDGIGPSRTSSGRVPAASAASSKVGDTEQPRSERQRYREATVKVREAVVDHVGVTEDEEQVIKDLVCTQRENVRGLFSDLSDGQIDADAFIQALGQERTLSSEGLRRSLGRRRYNEFRRLGVIGLLVPRLCKQR